MFRFRLQTVLRLRIAQRDERRGELAKAMRAADILREQREQLAVELADNQRQARALAEPGQANIDRIMHVHRYEAILRGSIVQLAAQEAQVAGEIERRRQALTEADRQVKVLEKLAERQRGEYERQEQRQEMKQIDEAAALAYSRRQALRREVAG